MWLGLVVSSKFDRNMKKLVYIYHCDLLNKEFKFYIHILSLHRVHTRKPSKSNNSNVFRQKSLDKSILTY